MLILVIVATVAFFIFSNRAGQLGEKQKAFWGFSGAAAVIAPATVVSIIASIIGAFLDYTPDWANTLLNIIGAFCLLAGIFLGKWMLDRFLPLPRSALRRMFSPAILPPCPQCSTS